MVRWLHSFNELAEAKWRWIVLTHEFDVGFGGDVHFESPKTSVDEQPARPFADEIRCGSHRGAKDSRGVTGFTLVAACPGQWHHRFVLRAGDWFVVRSHAF